MRPVVRGDSPIQDDFDDYADAFPFLAARLGFYCSYCERRVVTNLAVEHIQPKKLPQYAHLVGRWDNFLLGCVNCNSTKSNKDVILEETLLPDRDNTGFAYRYLEDGTITLNDALSDEQAEFAEHLLNLVGLDKPLNEVEDENGRLVAIDRVAQRMEARLIAEESLVELESAPSENMRRQVVRTALAQGYFSIWMTVFSADSEMKSRFITNFPGTAIDCYELPIVVSVSPRPGSGLVGADKV